MKNFESIRKACETSSSISKAVIDEFLLYHAATKYNLGRTMTELFSAYRHVTNEFGKEFVSMLKTQYVSYQIFRSGGLIGKILTHPELKKLSPAEMKFLERHARQPWRFSFSIIIASPSKDFFNMEDILTGERFLLFSPGISDILSKQSVALWFNLIGFNGDCWQSFGPIVPYKSFEPDDIFFFATELDRRLVSEEDIARSIDKNPVPYLMLLSGANYPQTAHKQDQLVQAYAEYPVDKVDTVILKKSFTSEFSHGVYRLSLKRWGNHPHFAQVFYDEKKKIVLLTACTDRGFTALVNAINQFGYGFDSEPDIRINISMVISSEKILKKKIKLNTYHNLFHVDTPPKKQEFIDKMNAFMGLILPDINAGRAPDIEKAAARAGIDIETARDFYKTVSDKFGQMDRRKG